MSPERSQGWATEGKRGNWIMLECALDEEAMGRSRVGEGGRKVARDDLRMGRRQRDCVQERQEGERRRARGVRWAKARPWRCWESLSSGGVLPVRNGDGWR